MTTLDSLGREHEAATGRFTGKLHGRPEVQLSPSKDGTFLYPPENWSSAEEYASFWMTVPVSDAVLGNVSAGYAELVRHDAVLDASSWTAKWDYAHRRELDSTSESVVRRAVEKRQEEWDDHYAAWCAERHERIRPNDARAIARVGQLVYFSSSLPDEAQEAIWQSTLRVDNAEKSVGQVYEEYRLGELRDYFQDPEATAAEKLEDLRLELRRMQLQPTE